MNKYQSKKGKSFCKFCRRAFKARNRLNVFCSTNHRLLFYKGYVYFSRGITWKTDKG